MTLEKNFCNDAVGTFKENMFIFMRKLMQDDSRKNSKNIEIPLTFEKMYLFFWRI